jgi:hypothetical protein
MKNTSILFCVLIVCMAHADVSIQSLLMPYKDYLQQGTYVGFDWSVINPLPKSRYHTFQIAFEHFEKNNGHMVVELGTSRSFVHGGLEGCNSDDTMYWTPDHAENWDWGAGFFTRMAAECLAHLDPRIHTVDIVAAHIERCKIMTQDFHQFMYYHVASSVDFLKTCLPESIDLLYVDTGDMTPIEPTALLQLEEARVIVENNLLSDNGIILIDDVRNQTPKQFGEASDLGKAKYSIPYFLAHGFEIIADEYQVILQKKS